MRSRNLDLVAEAAAQGIDESALKAYITARHGFIVGLILLLG